MIATQFDWLRVLNQAAPTRLGFVKHAVFDFDGTVSVLRQGWEPVMEQMMLEAIWPGSCAPEAVVSEVREYIDVSTGQLTIVQMRWLAEAVQRWGKACTVLSPREYKALYLDALMRSVTKRLEALEQGLAAPEDYMIAGTMNLLKGLAERGVQLYVASGSDHPDVVHEATALGIAPFITSGIYGALDASEVNAKDRIIQRILTDHGLSGNELLVAGDGPVEIIEGRNRGAITLGVASDEVNRHGWNNHKVNRLTRTGADLLVADYHEAAQLVDLLVA